MRRSAMTPPSMILTRAHCKGADLANIGRSAVQEEGQATYA